MDDFTIKISIPTDDDGFIPLRCPKCGEYFKLPQSDIESDEVIDIHCPLCGLISDNYITEDVLQLAETRALNEFLGGLHREMKSLERDNKKAPLKIKVNKLQLEDEIPIRFIFDSMEIVDFECCKKQGKIKYLLNYCGCYCPYCGEIQDGNK